MSRPTKTAPCRSCNADAPFLLASKDFNRRISTESFFYYRCRVCGLIFLHPVPADLGRYYEENYHMLPSSLDALERSAEVHEKFKVDLLRALKMSGRIIEVGPGAGGFALLANRAGFDVTTIEMSERACAFISNTLGVRAIHAVDEILALEEQEPADAIVMWQVLEHLLDPFRMLKTVAEKLKPEGVLIVATPNPNALQFRLFRKWWVHLDAPRHVTLIPPPLLKVKAEAVGLQVAWMTMRDRGSVYWNRFGWEYSLRNITGRRIAQNRVDRLAGWIAQFARPFETRNAHGTAYTAAFFAPPK